MSLEDDLYAIEQGFWLEGQQYFTDHLDETCLLAFPQMGEMHGVHSRERVAATATTANRWKNLRMGDRSLIQPADAVAIISYRANVERADGVPYEALIGSVYVRRPDGWKLTFHQHSPVEQTEDVGS